MDAFVNAPPAVSQRQLPAVDL